MIIPAGLERGAVPGVRTWLTVVEVQGLLAVSVGGQKAGNGLTVGVGVTARAIGRHGKAGAVYQFRKGLRGGDGVLNWFRFLELTRISISLKEGTDEKNIIGYHVSLRVSGMPAGYC